MAPLTRFTLKAALALAIVAALIAPLPASAQTLYGSITGTVTDQQGAAIPGATVTATNTGTGLKVEAVTDANGAYTFRNLLPGIYDLNASLEGFRALNQTGLRGLRRQPRPRGPEARGRRSGRDRERGQRDDAPADGEGRPQHRAHVEGDRQPPAQPVPELPDS